MSEKHTYLVTGANGFVGSHMVELLLEKGHRVRAMVRSLERAAPLQEHADLEWIEGNLQDAASLRAAVEGVDGVFAIASLFRQAGLPESTFYDINAEGTRRLLDACIDAGVPRLIHCSTVGVHGHIEHPPADEQAPLAPGDMYQRTKLAGEQIALDYFEKGSVRGCVIRPAMIYGPGDLRTLKLFRMIAKKRFFYVGKGLATVHFIDVRDLVQAFLLAMEHEEVNNEVFIICGQSAMTLRDFCSKAADILGVTPPWVRLPVKPMQWLGSACETVCRPLKIEPPIFRRRVDFYTKHRSFNGSKAEKSLGFKPAKIFPDELESILTWYKSNGYL